MRARLAEEGAIFLLAVQFLTRLPVRSTRLYSPARLAATPRWHPAVGLIVGAITGLVFVAAAHVFPPALAALLSTAAGLMTTGCFHEDGFADACDGLGGGATRERALEIMRDSRLGTYGAAGLGLMLGGKILALAALPVGLVPWVLLAAHAASRASSVLVMATSRYQRDHGTGKPVADGITGGSLAVALATGIAGLALLIPAAGLLPTLGAAAGLALGHLLMRSRFERRLGGYTGDCLGAVQQASEIGCYLGVLACL
ncbi:adenosylcobinamide-GDP ribazoletransferase [Rhodobacteraceae bacterium DSL-40]|uniref:adenosylcobinamide-GDP ribazoletransferase n=1 Tax=Amaricoccus sp. B4 TaxID=3368557 RepID=UPI000DAB6470